MTVLNDLEAIVRANPIGFDFPRPVVIHDHTVPLGYALFGCRFGGEGHMLVPFAFSDMPSPTEMVSVVMAALDEYTRQHREGAGQ